MSLTMNGCQAFAVLVVVSSLVQFTSAFQFTDCAAGKNPVAKMGAINVNSCPDTSVERCTFVKGQNATIAVDFEPTSAITQANIKIAGKLALIWLPFHLPGSSDACGHYGFNCPVKIGEKDHMALTLPILDVYPSVKVLVRFELNDEKNNPIVCFEFPVQIKPKK